MAGTGQFEAENGLHVGFVCEDGRSPTPPVEDTHGGEYDRFPVCQSMAFQVALDEPSDVVASKAIPEIVLAGWHHEGRSNTVAVVTPIPHLHATAGWEIGDRRPDWFLALVRQGVAVEGILLC